MTSIAPSKWSMSVRSDDRLSLKLMLQIRRYFYILSLPIIALYALILCGCISKAPRISTIFLAELRDDTTLLRFGYFGICTINGSDGHVKCSSTILYTPAHIATTISATPELTNYAIDLQRSMSFITPSFSSVLFFFGLLNLGVLQILHFKRKPSLISRNNQVLDKHILNLTLATRILLWASAAISLAAAHSMHSIISALQVSTSSKYGSVEGGPIIGGKTMEAMLWSSFALSILFNTIMQLATTDSRPRRGRKLSTLPYIKTGLEEREDSIRKITNATAQRLAVIDTRNRSNQSIRTYNSNTPIYAAMAHDSPLNPDFVALNSPGVQPPLATLQRRPTNPRANTRPQPSPLSLAWPNDQQTPLSPLSFLEPSNKPNRPQPSPSSSRRVEVRVPTQHELRQISPGLRGILVNTGRGTSSIYSRPATSPKIMEKSSWV